ncbi:MULTISPECIES: transposase [unclassified Streptomyces]|uniref:IS701 family transposase n=1 Tax=unclassified Streptomyces TaxID=2593676 RepID=UPI001F03B357|nr:MULTISPECIES: transposase [unclassified Streptomyces]MCH0564628.1 transposase [Streptomyces sp. MUM 2J]MCH0570328.1 transposase [Streptomyces sp. MUM 136J]
METAPPQTSSPSQHAAYTVHSESLEHFIRTIFKCLRRIDQRKWAHAYLSGLLVTPGKKSVRRIAAGISRDPSVVQSLRQFVSLSPWDFDDVMEEITRWVVQRRPEPVWSIGRAVLPKRGEKSVGVHRHFDLHSGRTLNCQLGLGAFLCVGAAQVPVDWCLHLPTTWTQDSDRRREARVPVSEHYRPMWAHALRLVDRLSARLDSPSSVVLADMSNEPDVGFLLRGLAKRRRNVVVAVPPHLAVLPVCEAAPAPVSARALVLAQSPETDVVPLPDGQQRVAGFQTSLVHLPSSAPGRSPGPPYRLFTETGPTLKSRRLWLTSLTHHTLGAVGEIAALTGGTTAVIDSLEQDFGLLDFEGRSYPGWYHHMALISAAYTFRCLHGVTAPPSRGSARQP